MWDLMGNNYSEVYGIGYALLNGISAGFYVSVMYKNLGNEIYFYYLDDAPYGELDDNTKNKIEDIIYDDLSKRHIFGRTDYVGFNCKRICRRSQIWLCRV